MASPRYPLEMLAELRKRKADEAARELALAVDRRGAAERTQEASHRRREEHRAAASRVREAEAEGLARGERTAADLEREGAWEARVAGEDRALLAEVDRARADVVRARAAEEKAGVDLREREAETQAASRHRARWDEEARKRAETREEEASLEAWRPPRT
jgi:hypothetical protein